METSLLFLHQNPNNNIYGAAAVDAPEYDLPADDYLIPENIPDDFVDFSSQIMVTSTGFVATGSSNPIPTPSNMKYKNGTKKYGKMERPKSRIAFRIKSDLETLDDGFKWRKYGKKMVKTSPNPRNYYKCSSGGCGVKKRVERDREDWSYVIATYEGRHNHEPPSLLYYYPHQPTLPVAGHDASPIQPSIPL